MKRFIAKVTLLSFIVLAFIWLTFNQADGQSDQYYLRFTTPKQSALILGASRAAIGLRPSVIDSILERKGLFNFSMTITNTPYGPSYFKSILKKLNPNSTDGIFILSVTPWGISSNCENPNDSSAFRENDLAISTIQNTNQNPNIEYLTKSFSKPYYRIWFPDLKGKGVHKDGWYEIYIDMDSVEVSEKTKKQLDSYTNFVKHTKFSTLRFSYLQKTIEKLSKHGEVYLVRMPVCAEMKDLEDRYMPDLNAKLENLSKAQNVPFFDLTTLPFTPTLYDGSHLEKNSARDVSAHLAKLILSHKK